MYTLILLLLFVMLKSILEDVINAVEQVEKKMAHQQSMRRLRSGHNEVTAADRPQGDGHEPVPSTNRRLS